MELDPTTEPRSKQLYVLLGSIAAILLGVGALVMLMYVYLVMP
ncbi:hypothetical protein [Bdellovibrio sp. KM01]|nr:hypothetical protein [Bdellovibrio sp. KM01]